MDTEAKSDEPQAAEAKPVAQRNHSARQLAKRPITFQTCGGEIVIGAYLDGKIPKVRIIHPATIPVIQAPAAPGSQLTTENPTP